MLDPFSDPDLQNDVDPISARNTVFKSPILKIGI